MGKRLEKRGIGKIFTVIVIAFFVVLISITGEAVSEDEGLVAYYSFDSDAKDYSGNKNDGTINGAKFVEGVSGKALEFDGINDYYVEVPAFMAHGTSIKPRKISVSVWSKPYNADGRFVLHMKGANNYLLWTPYNKYEAVVRVRGVQYAATAPTAFSSGELYNTVFTYNGSELRLYINGELVASNNKMPAEGIDYGGATYPYLSIGRYYTGEPYFYFNGTIDEVKIYNKALTPEEIKKEYEKYKLQKVKPDLVLDMKLDEGSGDIAKDNSGYNNDGKIEGAKWSEECISGKCLEFDGKDDFVEVPNSNTLEDITESSYTWGAWYYPLSVPVFDARYAHSLQAILCKPARNNIVLAFDFNSKFYFENRNASYNGLGVASSATYDLNNWYYVTGVVDDNSKTIKLYVNGELVGSSSYVGTLIDANTQPVRVGVCRNPGSSWDWLANGKIDEVKIWNKALSEQEIKKEYEKYKPKSGVAAAGVATTGGGERTATGGGGGAPIETPKLTELKVNPTNFNLYATVGTTSYGKISLENEGESKRDVSISLSNLDIVKLNETSVNFVKRGIKTVEFSIDTKEPGIYTGKILFVEAGKKTEVPFILNVKSEKILFDISLDIPDKFRQVKIGEKIKSQITLIQMDLVEKADVTLNYLIKDFDNKIYVKESETIAVEKQKAYEKEFDIQNLQEGSYVLGAEIIYSGGIATASSQFNIAGVKAKKSNIMTFVALAIVIAVFMALIIIIKRYKKPSYHKHIERTKAKRGS